VSGAARDIPLKEGYFKALVTFFVMLLMCGPHDKLLSMVIPKYFALLVI
jgi:hypothetical protein